MAGVLTLLLADTEGSVRLWESDRKAAAEAFARLDEIVADAAARHGANRPLEQGEGDSFVLAFAEPASAAACALGLQQAIGAESWPAGLNLKVRMALHAGTVEVRPDGRYTGHAFNRAARLRALAHGGQVLLTRAAADAVANELPSEATLRDLGEHRLRDLAKPERISQLCHPDLADDFPPIRSLTALPNNLPPQTTSFVGREEDLENLASLVATERLVTLTGAGGCGKTRLAIHVAAETSDSFRDGVWYADLAPVADPSLVPGVVAKVLGIRDDAADDLLEAIERATKERQLLLVLDNCEHLVEATARLAERLMAHNVVLATSREPLGVAGEHAYRVPSLALENAVGLFAERASKVRPNFRLSDCTGEVAEICKRLDGIPLAIELAAARTRMLSPRQIVKALEDRFHLLTGGARTALPRQRTLEASVDWSYTLLTDDEKTLLNRLSVFAGSFSLDAAEEVAFETPEERYAVLDLLTGLVDRSLVQVETTDQQDRYRLLETIRVYARDRLDASGQIASARTRHLDHYIALAETAEPHLEGSEAPAWFRRLDAELDNIRAALDWGLASGDPGKVLRLAGSIWALWWIRGAGAEISGPLHAALEAGDTDTNARLKGLMAAEAISFYTGDFAAAGRLGTEAVDIALGAGDLRRGARALIWLAWAHTWMEPLSAVPLFEKGMRLADEADSNVLRAFFSYGIGLTQILIGSTTEGEANIRRGVEIASPIADSSAGHALSWYGIALFMMGRLDDAEAASRRALGICRIYGDMMFETASLLGLQLSAIHRGDIAAARAFAAEIEPLVRRSGFAIGNTWGRFTAHWVEAVDGHPAGVAPELDLLLEESRRYGHIWGHAMLLCAAADVHLAIGDVERARALATEARSCTAERGMPWSEGLAIVGLSRASLAATELADAEELAYEALAVLTPVQGRLGLVEALELVACSTEKPVHAARLLGAASAAREVLDYRRLPYNEPLISEHVSRIRSALGAAQFETSFAEGAAMSLDDAVTFALRGRGPRSRPAAGWEALTPAELSVVSLVAQGLTNPEIASKLLVSRNTVKAHLAHVFTKLGLATRSELAAEATRRGL